MGFKLKRTRQCAKCPWKVSTNPHEIPNGYNVELHRGLASTIARPGDLSSATGERHVMACHEHPPGTEVYCIGWLMNQLTFGNNIGMRLKMIGCENIGEVRLDGNQHRRFEDTLPKGK